MWGGTPNKLDPSKNIHVSSKEISPLLHNQRKLLDEDISF